MGSIPAPGTHVAHAPFAPGAVLRRSAVGALRLGFSGSMPAPGTSPRPLDISGCGFRREACETASVCSTPVER